MAKHARDDLTFRTPTLLMAMSMRKIRGYGGKRSYTLQMAFRDLKTQMVEFAEVFRKIGAHAIRAQEQIGQLNNIASEQHCKMAQSMQSNNEGALSV